MVHWSIGLLVHWSIGPFVHLSIGPLVHWSMFHWSIGPLDHLSICPFVHWSIGPLVCWSIGPLVECQMLNVNKIQILSERNSGVPPVIFIVIREAIRQCFLFSNHLIITTRTHAGRLDICQSKLIPGLSGVNLAYSRLHLVAYIKTNSRLKWSKSNLFQASPSGRCWSH